MREEKVFKDPVHQYIYVQDDLIWNLINTKEFQRLRRIRQLGTSYFTFHGAEHSRFSHSLGVYEIVRQTISLFSRNHYRDWPSDERLLALASALLHDVGHGPFSHTLEHVFGVSHEEWSRRIILGDTEIHHVLCGISPDFPGQVADVIAKKNQHPVAESLVSSQLDADRMDYLLRDAYFTGVNYGRFDLERILRLLRPHQGHVVIKKSGMHAVEDYLMARYQMYWQVYFHPVTRSSEILTRKILERARDLTLAGKPPGFMLHPLTELFSHELRLEDYLLLDDSFMQVAFMQWSEDPDSILADLSRRFIHRHLFKYREVNQEAKEALKAHTVEFRSVGCEPEYYLEFDFPSDLFYDVYQPGNPDEMRPIYLLEHDNQLTEISESSEIVRSISGIRRGVNRVYYPAEIITKRIGSFSPAIRSIFESE